MANMTNREPLIETKKLKKYFPLKKNLFSEKNQIYVRAVEDINLTIFRGETFGLVGESGCGKSTLGRVILQLYPPTSGSAAYYGELFKDTKLTYIVKLAKKLPHYQDKARRAFQKSVVIDEEIVELEAEYRQYEDSIKNVDPDTKEDIDSNKKKEAMAIKLQKRKMASKNCKKQASRYLREGSRLVGKLILEENIHEISDLLIQASEKVDHYRDILAGLNNVYPDYFTSELRQIFDKIQSFKGQKTLPITERALDPEYQERLEQKREVGVMLPFLNKEEMRTLRRKLQIIFQDPYSSLDSRMTIGQIIGEAVAEHGLFKKGSKELEDYVVETMSKCGLDHYMLHRFPHQFSGGQRQRVGIARALALKPEFIVCDEAVSALDVSIQSQIINLLMELKASEKLTYLFISHDLSVIKHVSDRIGVMYLGVMVELGPSDEIYQNPYHPYTKALMSAIPTTDEVQPQRILLEGDIPSNIFPPSGCKFRTRCPLAQERCALEVPEYREITPGHFVACHYYEKTKDMK